MARGMAVSSFPVPCQLAHRLRQRVITNMELQAAIQSSGCAPLTARRLGVSLSSVSNTICGRADSYFITRELYNLFLDTPASKRPEVAAYIGYTAPPSLVNGLEALARAEHELATTQLLLEVQDLLLSRLPVEQQVRQLAADTERVMTDYSSVESTS